MSTNTAAAIWLAITTVRKHELERLKGQNAAMRCQLALMNYEITCQAEKAKPAQIFIGPDWRRRPRRRYAQEHAQGVPAL